ncbi:MAG: c-type cytochrome [Polyangiaceae bacterium]
MRYRALAPTIFSGVALISVGLASACSSAPNVSTTGSLVAVSESSGKCEAFSADGSLKPVENLGQGSTVALGKFADGPLAGKTIAFVADEDAQAIIAVDVDTKKELGSHKLASAPSQLMILSDGRVAVALKNASKVEILHPASDGSFVDGCAVDTDAEPVALASTPDGKTLLVTAGWGHSLDVYETAGLTSKGKIDLPREPRGVVVDDSGKHAFIVHAVGGRLTTVDLDAMRSRQTRILSSGSVSEPDPSEPVTLTSAVTGALGAIEGETPGRFGTRVGCQGYPVTKSTAPAGRILAPQVLVDPGDPDNHAAGYGDGSVATEVTNVAVIDAGTQRILPASLSSAGAQEMFFREDGSGAPLEGECILPRAATVDGSTQSLLVACFGIDAIVAYDAASASPGTVEKARWDVGSGPTGIAVDPDGHRAIVWSQFERTVDVIDLSSVTASDREVPRPERIALNQLEHPLTLQVMLGRQIFNTVGDSRISKDGRACASCHPDGRDDSITWSTPDGPRRTVMLAGRLQGTEPFAWAGSSKDLREHLHHTFDRLSGQGLRSVDLDALTAYVQSLPAPPREAVTNPDLVAQGKAIFESKEAECATCHAAGRQDGKTHDVQSRHHADKKVEFDTPSLSFVSGRAPYFHDGRYATLRELLVESDGTMGHTRQLKSSDIDALEAYLHSL